MVVTKKCAACGSEFNDLDSETFLTCHACRKPDKPSKRQKRGCRRFGYGHADYSGRRPEARELTRETKFGLDR